MEGRTSMKIADDRSDSELLLAYGRDGEEAAFEALAGRHVDMIFAVSLRRSNNRQLAEEATQNVLLSLSRKARKLSAQERNLTAWLHTSSRFEVSKLQRREARIRKREQTYASATMTDPTQDEAGAFERLYPLLDQTIDRLRVEDREVIVRRYLEGQTFRSIGKALGITDDAAQKRTSRAFERLNQIFKRKAGVTVSATAMIAGISRHTVEAAPAACLDFAGKAASASLASAAATTMSIGQLATTAAAVVAIGGGAVFLASRDETPATTVNTSQAPAGAAAVPTPASPTEIPGSLEVAARTVAAEAVSQAGDQDDYSPQAELARIEAMNPHPGKDEFARRLGAKHERMLEELSEELGLSAAQAASVKKVLDARVEAFRSALDEGPQPGDSEAESFRKEGGMVAKAGGIIRGVGLREDLAPILSNEQLSAYDQREAEAWQSQVESHAYIEFSKLAPVLGLTEEQKDRTFELLQASSEETLRADGAARAYIAMQKGQAAPRMNLTDPVDMDFILEAFEGPDPLTPGSPEFEERIIKAVGGQIEKRVEFLAPVLDERQTQRYRDYLVQQSLLGQFGIELPSPEDP